MKLQQTVNLYRPLLRKPRQRFSGHFFMLACVVLAATQGLLFAMERVSLATLNGTLTELSAREETTRRQLASVESLVNRPLSVESLRREIERLELLIRKRREVVTLIGSENIVNSLMSPYLEAIAAAQVSGVWLTRIQVDARSRSLDLLGKSEDPSLVPEYIAALKNQPALRGLTFVDFKIDEQADETGYAFALAGGAADAFAEASQ